MKIVKDNPILQYKINELIDDSDGPLMSLPYIDARINRNFIDNIYKPTPIAEDNEDHEIQPHVASNQILQKTELNHLARPVNLKLKEEVNNNVIKFLTPQLEKSPKPPPRKTKSTSSAETPIDEKSCPVCTFLCNKTINFCPMCYHAFF